MSLSKTLIPLSALIGLFFFTSCKRDKDQTALEYMPNMYRSPSYETYDPNPVFADGLSAQLPPVGSVPRGYVPYEYPNSQAGYDSALAHLRTPLRFEETEREGMMAESKELYTIFCSHCHGDKGDGNGILAQREKFLGIPSYGRDRLPNITEGSIFHVITYGKNLMGSHASQLTEEERWKIVNHVLYLRNEISADPDAEAAEETMNQTEA